jgi:pyrimidine operon attenuation protein/uracil phosphoribosyltransferase
MNLNAEDLYAKLLKRLRAEIKAPQGAIYLAGLAVGGAWIAERLAKDLGLPSFGTVNVSFHRDDYAEKGLAAISSAGSMPTQLSFDVNGAHLVLIDDVLHTGRTVRAALNELFDFGRPSKVSLMVLVDRQKRDLPITADFAADTVELADHQILVLNKDQHGQFSFQLEKRS